jgi:hypothetical protein
LRAADRAEQRGVRALTDCYGLGGERLPDRVDRRTADERLLLREVVPERGGDCLVGTTRRRCDFGADAVTGQDDDVSVHGKPLR